MSAPPVGAGAKLAIVGKGGVGKTSLSATLARLLARRGHAVLAIDGDPNPNLALALGVAPAAAEEMPGLPEELIVHTEAGYRLTRTFAQIRADYAIEAPDGVTLLAMRPEQKAGAG
jgi:CO dehydrogenase maturation factor